jgi:hypothetical protein
MGHLKSWFKQGTYISFTLIYLVILISCSGTKGTLVSPTVTRVPKATITNDEPTPIQTQKVEPTAIISGRVTLFSSFDLSFNQLLPIEDQINFKNTLAFFDFDTGEVTTVASADIYLYVGCGSDCFNTVVTINGATSVFWFEGTELGYAGCRQVLQGERNSFGVEIVPGKYSCLLTNAGNIVQILAIENDAETQPAKFTFEYKLWRP